MQDKAKAAYFVPLFQPAASPEDAATLATVKTEAICDPFDVVILGMGTDGHTASFFPGGDNLYEALDLDEQGVTDDDIVALASSPHASRLTQLNARFNVLTERGIDALAASPYLKKLEVVNLEPNQLDPVDRLEYYDETHQHAVPTEAGRRLEERYGPLRWLRRAPPAPAGIST